MNDQPQPKALGTAGMSAATAMRVEYSIIGLGMFALVLIFQPFSLTLFGIGAGLVVLAGLVNNLLPLAQPGTTIRTLISVALVIAMIFCIVLLLSIAAAHFYGVYFLSPVPGAATTVPSDPFYLQPFVWGVAVVAAVLAALITLLNQTAPQAP